MEPTALDTLRGSDRNRWPNIATAASLSSSKMAEIKEIVGDLLPTDEGSLVVFGSLARGEFTQGSDLDWSILIDGRADSAHTDVVNEARRRFEDHFKEPGPTGLFGGLVFSHDLIHAIGGDEDTNKNMTRRLLLMLESLPVDTLGSKSAHKRIVEGVLNRYVIEDANFIFANKKRNKIPRFLLNDVVRFWRTMAVDYVNKYRARPGQGWALRNIKLRMSRKLLFISGLFMCISWALDSKDESGDGDEYIVQKLVTHLFAWTQRPPLESLAIMVYRFAPDYAGNVFDPYDSFLSLIDDENARKTLKTLAPDQAYENDIFLEARRIADLFDSTLLQLLFDTDDTISNLIKKYGVF